MTAEVPSHRWRAYARIGGLAGLLLIYAPLHILTKLLNRGRSNWPRRFLRSAAHIVGARPTVHGDALGPHSFVISNHVSWLDILVLGGTTGTAFVSKAEVKQSPLIGWLADQNRTVYVDRGERSDAHGQIRRIGDALQHSQPLTVFPEGTTGNGRELLPFRTTLLHAVAPPPPGAIVRPVALDYHEAAAMIVWTDGEPGVTNALRVLGRRGTIRVTVQLLDPLPATDDRKHLARTAREVIDQALPSVGAGTAV